MTGELTLYAIKPKDTSPSMMGGSHRGLVEDVRQHVALSSLTDGCLADCVDIGFDQPSAPSVGRLLGQRYIPVDDDGSPSGSGVPRRRRPVHVRVRADVSRYSVGT